MCLASWHLTKPEKRKPLKGKGYATLMNMYFGALNIMYIFLVQKALEVHKVGVFPGVASPVTRDVGERRYPHALLSRNSLLRYVLHVCPPLTHTHHGLARCSTLSVQLQCNLKGNELKLAADPNEPCFGPKYDRLKLLSYVSIAVYGFGIPFAMAVILFRHRSTLTCFFCSDALCSRLRALVRLSKFSYYRYFSRPVVVRLCVCALRSCVYCRKVIMADQRLRVRNMSDSLATNPYYFMQKRFKRLYFKFAPERYYWCVL